MPDLPLRDIHLPPSVIEALTLSLTTYLLLVAIFIVFICATLLMKKQLKPSLKRQALKKLELIQKRFHETKDPVTSLSEISVFLRRAVLSQKESSHVTSLSGKAWLEFLDVPLKSQEFSEGDGKILLNGPYQSAADEAQVVKLLELTFKWVRAL